MGLGARARSAVRLVLAVTAGALTVAVVGASVVLAQEQGSIHGIAVNGTRGGAAPAGDVASLDGFRVTERLETRTVEVGPDGTFAFSGVDGGTEYAYVVTVEHQGAQFSSDLIQLTEAASAEVSVEVFDVTTDDPGISFRSVTRLLRRQTADAASVVEIVEITVPGDRAFRPAPEPGSPPPLRFSVPDGAFDLQAIGGMTADEMVIGGPGFAVFAALSPGVASLAYGYQLALPGGETSFEWSVSLPAETVRLLSDATGLITTVQGLAERAPTEFGDLAVRRWEAERTPGGATFAIEVADASVSGFARAIRSTTTDRWALYAAGAAVALAIVSVTWRRGWRRPRTAGPARRARELLDAIAAIDAGGSTDDGAVAAEERARIKRELIALLSRRPDAARLLGRSRGRQGPERGQRP